MFILRFIIFGGVLATLVSAPLGADTPSSVRVNGKAVPFETWHEKILPGESMTVDIPSGYTAEFDGVAVSSEWVAPSEAGIHALLIKDPWGRIANKVSVFVLEPATKINGDGYLNGYRIGVYPRNTPEGFMKLEKGDRDVSVSPHFKVGQFLCKQQPGHWPKYVTVTKSNLKRLEALLENLNDDGETDAQTLFVMSGFRTPFYNAAIGSAKFSRHMYGDAADVYLDVKPRDGVMDDINDDGEITKADANYLYYYAEDLFDGLESVEPGGLGSYKANAVHGPFVHVDGRGKRARWGR